MEIKSLTSSKKNSEGLYNLYVNVINNINVVLIPFTCTNRHNMRIDLVCYDIYENINYIDMICNINGIMNVFNIKSNDIIYYIEEDDIINMISDDTVMENIRNTIINANKSKDYKLDKNRLNDVINRNTNENNKNYLPPNILPSNSSNQIIENGKIIFKSNL